MSDDDTTIDQEDELEDLEEDQELDETTEESEDKSKDPLDNIDDAETLREEAKKFRGIANRKAKPPQESKPEPKKETPVEKTEEVQLTPMDAILLSKMNVTEKEDIEEVLAYANFKKIPVSEALNNSTVKTILAERKEQRDTAQATNTGTARRGSSKLSDEQIVANVDEGKFPDDPEALAEARMNLKKSKLKK